MNKKILYNVVVSLGDFLAFFILCLLSNILITQNFEKINLSFIITALSLSFIKVCAGYFMGTYKYLWMYSIRRNLTKLVVITLSIDLIFLAISFIPYFHGLTGFRTLIYLELMLLEFVYIIITRFIIYVFFTHIYKKNDRKTKESVRTIIIGAGAAGSMVLNELGRTNEFGYHIVGFVDDSKGL